LLKGNMEGRETALEIQEAHGIPVVLIAGIGDKTEEKAARLRAPSGVGFLLRPFKNSDLLNEMSRVLLSGKN